MHTANKPLSPWLAARGPTISELAASRLAATVTYQVDIADLPGSRSPSFESRHIGISSFGSPARQKLSSIGGTK